MALTNTRTSWGSVSRTFHWGMAVLVIAMLVAGTVMVDWPDEELATKFTLYQWHKSFGMLLAALLVLRLVWRWLQPVPELPPSSSRFTRRASAVSHGLLYALLLLLPLTGYLMVATSPLGIPTVVFGVVPVPHVLGPDAGLEAVFKTAHDVLGKLLIAVVLVHVLAALKHALVDRDGIWTRMTRGNVNA